MTGIIERLVADLKWRLTKAGRKYRPKKQERESWAALRIPTIVPILVWAAYFISFGLAGIDILRPYLPEWLHFLICSWPGWILSFYLLFQGSAALNRNFELKAYTKLLRQNERFTLVEYAKYLQRQIKRASEDPALGGPAEVARLRQVRNKLHELLRKGAGKEMIPVESTLSQEVDLAEAVVQAYEPFEENQLFADLDERLPGELRQRIEALDLEVEQSRSARRELEN